MTTAEIEAGGIESRESTATKIVRYVSKAPVYIVLVFLGLLWLVPTIGLFFTSLLDSSVVGRVG